MTTSTNPQNSAHPTQKSNIENIQHNNLEPGTIGNIISINGPVLKVKGFENHRIGDMVDVGSELHIIGEIIKIFENECVVQCFEETGGLELNDTVVNHHYPLSMELGPGILNSIYDGIQRPLPEIAKVTGDFISRGINVPSIDREKIWEFKPEMKEGQKVEGGMIIGTVQESSIEHKILIPPTISGTLISIKEGKFTVLDEIAVVQDLRNNKHSIQMLQKWPIRTSRPFKERFLSNHPLITGTRVFDLLFPIARGGCVAVPGGFGTGKTVVQHSLAKFSDANIIVYVGCGERGNEMADLLNQFPELEDPINHRPLMERTVMIANTSNMPVSAREASIFAGITIAEYWRDQGKNVLVLADSTSRWAEALREISGRLEEMPTEGGYPAYLSSRLSDFYERAGYVMTLCGQKGSVTIVGAVSPAGGDFSEPVTKNTKRYVQAFWGLDPELAYARHYPSVNWNESYSLYNDLSKYWEENIEEGWQESRLETNFLLSRSDELANVAQLIGTENLPADQQLQIFMADLIKDGFLIQNAFDDVDKYSSPQKTMKIIKIIIKFYNEALFVIKKGVPFFRIREMDCIHSLKRMRLDISNDKLEDFNQIVKNVAECFLGLKRQYSEFF